MNLYLKSIIIILFFLFFFFLVAQTLTEKCLKCLQKVKLIPVERFTKSQLNNETVQGDHHPVTASEVK